MRERNAHAIERTPYTPTLFNMFMGAESGFIVPSALSLHLSPSPYNMFMFFCVGPIYSSLTFSKLHTRDNNNVVFAYVREQ